MSMCLKDSLFYGMVEYVMFWHDVQQNSFHVGRFLFALFHYILVLNIMLAIVSAIIIDSFSEKRSFRDKLVQKLQSSCFVCDLPRDNLEATADGGFESHLANEHYLWDYAFLMYYLDDKELYEITMTGSEVTFSNMWKSGRLDKLWPNRRAMCVEIKEESKEEDRAAEELANMTKRLEKVDRMVTQFIHHETRKARRMSELSDPEPLRRPSKPPHPPSEPH